MDKKLKKFMNEISPEESAFLERSLARTANKARIGKDPQARILAASMRKAGFEMTETQARKTIRMKKIKKVVICGLAAVIAIISAVGWTRENRYIFEKVKDYFRQDISPFETDVMKHAQTVENDDLKMSIDGVLADEVKCSIVITLTSKTERGEELLEQLNYGADKVMEKETKYCKRADILTRLGLMSDDDASEWVDKKLSELPPHMYTVYFENAGRTCFEYHGWETIFGTPETNPSAFENMFGSITTVRYSPNNTKHHHYQKFTLEMSEIDISQPLVIREFKTGLSAELDLSEYIDSHRLVSEDPNAFDYAIISPLAIYIRSTEHDRECGRALSDGGWMHDGKYTRLFINYKDGTSEELSANVSMHQAFNGDAPDHDTDKEAFDEYMTEHWHEDIIDQSLETYCDHLLEIEKIRSVTIDGIEYTIQ